MASARKIPLHERLKPLSKGRDVLRSWYFNVARKTFETDDGKRILVEALDGLLARDPRGFLGPNGDREDDRPYPELGRPQTKTGPADRADVIIVSGRFRSGSTLLWNLFRNLDSCSAYYEPLNERRWFDLGEQGRFTDKTHKNVSDYWREYESLGVLKDHYRENWIREHLLMGEDFVDDSLKRYVEILIDKSPGRPVLQFNRIDFRLPWFRRHFPNAAYVHIFRHPRDQWCSTLLEDLDRFTKDDRMSDFAPFDKFYLRMWASDLKYRFPFLDERGARHPYELFYYLWKLSYLFGKRYCSRSIQYEALASAPAAQIRDLLDGLGIDRYEIDRLTALVVKPEVGKWSRYADDAWFRDIESRCETVLTDFLDRSQA